MAPGPAMKKPPAGGFFTVTELRALLLRNLRVLRHLGPARHVALYLGREFFRRIADGLGARGMPSSPMKTPDAEFLRPSGKLDCGTHPKRVAPLIPADTCRHYHPAHEFRQ
jgi:hypothetical protein